MASRFKVGNRVILGRHQHHIVGGTYWEEEMNEFVGKIATLTIQAGSHYYGGGGLLWRVDIDDGAFLWREVNMQPAIENKNPICLD